MKVILNYFNVQCAHCGSGIRGERAWLEAPAIVVECPNPECSESGKQFRLPINKIELEPFVMPKDLGGRPATVAENADTGVVWVIPDETPRE